MEILNEASLTEAIESNEPILVDFFAPWCGPCRSLSPIVEKLATEYSGKVRVIKVNTDLAPGVIAEHSISGLPTLVSFKGGREVGRLVGMQGEKKVRNALDILLTHY